MERLPKAIFFIFLIESQLVIQISFVILFLLPIDLLRSILHKQFHFVWTSLMCLMKMVHLFFSKTTMGRYRTESEDQRVIGGKLACVNKGIAFCRVQLISATTKFKTSLSGSCYEESLNMQGIVGGTVYMVMMIIMMTMMITMMMMTMTMMLTLMRMEVTISPKTMPQVKLKLLGKAFLGAICSYGYFLLKSVNRHLTTVMVARLAVSSRSSVHTVYGISALTYNQRLCCVLFGWHFSVPLSESETDFTIVLATAYHSATCQHQRLLLLWNDVLVSPWNPHWQYVSVMSMLPQHYCSR